MTGAVILGEICAMENRFMTPEPDVERLTRWVERHGPAVRGFLLSRLGPMGRDSNTIDDLLQETFFRAWRHRKKFLDEGKDRPYLLKIADRLLVDEFRKRRWKTQPLEGDVFSRNDESDHRMLDMENREMLRKAMGLLSEPQQRTLLLRFYGQMSFQDIAQHLGCPLSTALSHCRRGLESLRQLLVSVDP